MHARNRTILAGATALAAALTLAACGGGSDTGGATGDAGDDIAVAAGDDSCDVAKADLDAGTHRFTVTNGGSKVTEFYVYADGDRVMGEV
ncbi:MAG TPA: peptidase M75, partial [Modestobacter sp.]|nr:peptidase M75 [Modestobacter sp.]